ncbi:MAG TPA: glycoside hydrolase family 38 C-terminal domain-containing protein [Gaiellaceae bacterium]|nr:glycoside hydrolase family 38 C-terminal domain-containing protein [Gaiellaceae bacterium]
MIRHPEYTRARLAQTAERLRELVWPETRPLDELLVSEPADRVAREDAQALAYRAHEPGERFGPLWTTFWFRGRATVPAEWGGRRVDLLWETPAEATLYLDGVPAQGLNRHHRDAFLLERATGGERLAWEIELACNGLFGKIDVPVEVHRAELGAFDPDAWELLHDFETLRALEAAEGLDASLAGDLQAGLDRFCTVWEHDPGAARGILAELLARRNGTHAHAIRTMGHAHLDTAWLWPLAESHRKAVRTFSSQLRYMDAYPDYRFACSQAVHYAWMEEQQPELWRRIREKVEAGRFVPVGATWVEPDCNLPSGESLLRQFLHGQRWFESRFGRRCTEFWSPDAFGYSGQLPQIMRACGVTRFLTQKLSWNRFTKPDHHTFTWEGVDGSRVLGHFPPLDTYSSEATVSELLRSATSYKDHFGSGTSLLLFGLGDGGGGPTRPMLETLARVRDLQGVPRTEPTTAEAFFDALEAERAERPTVLGELYLEYHRGTYTSQARTKLGNRRAEAALHDAEFLWAARGERYPREELDRLWKLLLLNQFHDILPGSSIRQVTEEAERDLAAVVAGAEALAQEALGAGDVPVNTLGFARREVARTPAGDLRVVEAPPYGAGAAVDAAETVTRDGLVLENEHLRVELSADGSLLSLVHRATGREALAAPGNRLELYDDRPVAFDAWDVDPVHLETRRDAAAAHAWEVVTEEPLRVELGFERRLSDASTIRQVVRLDAGSPRLEVHSEVDWHESHTMLKVAFPLAVRAPVATYETAFGTTERPTHFSTAWDRARYEVPAHRFADLSEHGFGVALLSDAKYGWSCHGSDLRLSLLRSPKSPDPAADMGAHRFAYALLPHAGGWREAGVLAEAHRFNQPLRWGAAGALEAGRAVASVDDPNLVLDTVKRAESSDELVLRLYEAHGARGTALLHVALPFSEAVLATGLEDDLEPLRLAEGAVELPYLPHQLLTVKLR